MSASLTKANLLSLSKEELQILCENRDLGNLSKRMSKSQKLELLTKCPTIPRYSNLNTNSLRMEIKARGLDYKLYNQTKSALRDVLKNFQVIICVLILPQL